MQLFDGESDTIVRGASAPVIALLQGEGPSSDGGSSQHEATPRSKLLDVKTDREAVGCEFYGIVRGTSASVIALWQGEGASSDGGSPPHDATPHSELLVSSDGSSYAAPSAGLAPDTRIACVSDNAIACATRKCARDRTVAGRGRLVRRRLNTKTTMPVSSLAKRKIVPARGNRALSESRRARASLLRRLSY
jgi:hypothetical protein